MRCNPGDTLLTERRKTPGGVEADSMRRRALVPLALTVTASVLAITLPAGASSATLSFRRTELQDQKAYG